MWTKRIFLEFKLRRKRQHQSLAPKQDRSFATLSRLLKAQQT